MATNQILSKDEVKQIIERSNIESATDISDVLKSMFKDIIQEILEVELEEALGYQKYTQDGSKKNNYRNGYGKKELKTDFGPVEIQVPRDRNAEFNPQIIGKRQTDASGIEEKVISLYARGMTQRDISDQIKDLYDIEISQDVISKITDKVIPEVKEWQNRTLDSMYPFVFMDAIHYKVRTDGRVVNRAAYVAVGIDVNGMKDVLGIWIGENETSKFWLNVLNSLKNRGVKDVLMFCVDGLLGFKEAINAAFPNSEIQRCIIHQLRYSFKFVSYKHIKEFSNDFKKVYKAATEEQALLELDMVEDKWGKKYPHAISTWRNNWDVLNSFYQFPDDIRRIMYTTNIIEGLNRQYRKATKNRTIFPTDLSLEKALYLATKNITAKWTNRYKNWDKVLSQLSILYDDRITEYLR